MKNLNFEGMVAFAGESWLRLAIAAMFLAAGGLGVVPTADAAVDAQKRFVELNCNRCHAIQSLGIGVEEGDDDEDEVADGDVESPDLSSVGVKRDKVWIARYLLRRETIEDREHPRRFRASREDLGALAEWLETLKHEAPGGAAESAD